MHRILRPFARLAAALLVCLSVPASAEEKASPPLIRPALWKVADKDTTIYLFGTIHALPKGVQWFEGKVATAFDGSQELVTEIVESDAATMQGQVMKRATLPQGQTLRGLLSSEEKAGYEAALTRLGLPAQAFDGFDPWYAAIGLSILPLTRDGFASENGVEAALDARAKARGLTHGALETAEYQLDLFDSLPLDAQKVYLAEVVKDLPTIRDDLAKMVEAWKRGDSDELARLMNAEESDPALLEALLTRRNRAWADWIGERLKKPGTVFMAVGAGHLAGPGSVQDQLKARGITTRRVQ